MWKKTKKQAINVGRGSNVTVRLTAFLRERIESGIFEHRLPGERILAREFGVALQTVQRALTALHDEGVVERIPRSGTFVAEKKSSSKRILSAVLGGLSGHLQAHILEGMRDAAMARNSHVLLGGNLENLDVPKELAVEQALSFDQADAVVLWPCLPVGQCPALKHLQTAGIPFCTVMADDSLQETGNASSIRIDDVRGGELAAEHLIQQGRRRIGFVTFPKNEQHHLISRPREQGVRQALHRAGLEASPAIVAPWTAHSFWDDSQSERFLEDIRGFDALVCGVGDDAAFHIRLLLNQHGLRVPEDLALVSFDNSRIARQFKLSSLDPQPYRIGQLAATLLLDQLEGKTPRSLCETVVPTLEIRDRIGICEVREP